ncbi:MAG: DNA polymerase, partial [Candidatus Bathyarchaeia archaeon]
DVNSLYPFVMREYEYPVRLVNFTRNISLQALQYAMKRYYVIAKVRLKTEDELFPTRLNNRLCYVRGDFITTLHHAELVRALEANAVVEVKEAAFFRKGKIFCDYVDYFYSRRIEAKDKGNDDLAYIYKLLLNSLYGKFGQKGYRRKVEKICDSDAISVEEMISLDTRKMRQVINWFGTLIYEEEEGESYNSAPSISGAVTAYGREYLLKLIKKAGLEHVFYVDTDSLIVDEIGYENLKEMIDNRQLGKLKVEGVGDYLVIRNLKDYTLGNKQKIKGVKKGAVQIAENIYQEEKFEGFRGALKRGKLDSVIVEKSIKVLSRVYRKGIVAEDGRVLPFTLTPLL